MRRSSECCGPERWLVDCLVEGRTPAALTKPRQELPPRSGGRLPQATTLGHAAAPSWFAEAARMQPVAARMRSTATALGKAHYIERSARRPPKRPLNSSSRLAPAAL